MHFILNKLKLYVLEEQGLALIFHNLGIALEGIDAEIHELAIVIEEDGGGGFLIITSIAGIEDLYS